jgi:competence protein ComEC
MSETTIPQTFSRHPLLWLAVWFVVGIVVEEFLDLDYAISLTVALGLATCCLVWWRSSAILLPIIFLFLGAFCYETETSSTGQDRIKRIYDDGRIQSYEPVDIEGVLLGLPEPAFGGTFLLLRVEKLNFKNSIIDASGKVRLFVPMDDRDGESEFAKTGIGYGSRLRVYCRLEREEKFQNPGVASRLAIFEQQGIDATATVKSSLLFETLGREPPFVPLGWIYEQRQHLIYEFREHLSPPAAGVMIASLLGDQHFLDRQTSEVFRDGGTFHVLVISGLHITFIGGLTLWLVSYFVRRRILQFVLAASFLWGYTFAVGAEVPVVRASIMFTVLLFSRVVYRQASQLNVFGFCCLMLLVWHPAELFSASFQLTVVSVAAIVGCAFPLIEKLRAIGSWTPTAEHPFPPHVSKRLRSFCELLYWNDTSWKIEKGRQIWTANLFKAACPGWRTGTNLQSLISYLFEGLLVSIIVQIWMLPLLVIYFHRVSPVSVLLNLWVGGFLALESFCAVFAVLMSGLSEWLAAPLTQLTELLNDLMIWLPAWFSDNQLASFRLPNYSGGLRSVYFLFGIAVLIPAVGIFKWSPFDLSPQHKWTRRVTSTSLLVTSGLGLVIIFHPFSSPGPDGRLTIDFLDVGQGDSALVTFPDGATMLVDGGGQTDLRREGIDFEPDRRRIGETVVSEFLWEKGYSHIDYLVATHADADHIQGLADVARNFDIGLAFVGTAPTDDPDFSALMRVAESRKIPVTTLSRGDEFVIGGARVSILNPPPYPGARTSANNSSVVMNIRYGDRAFLLTGDIERDVETELLADPSSHLRADVVKVPHHGSRTSSTEGFVYCVGAATAVISVGKRSRFGHPHAEIVDRWRHSGAQVLKTGETGTVTIRTDGNNIQVQSFLP